MWLVALQSVTHLEEVEIRHMLVLLDSASVVVEVDADLSDS